MKTIKTADAEGAALNWLVTKCEGGCLITDPVELKRHLESLDEDNLWITLCENTPGAIDASIMSQAEMIDYGVRNWRLPGYSTAPMYGGPILDAHKISTDYAMCYGETKCEWEAVSVDDLRMGGPTRLVAAMRCYVASVLGDTVEVPECLL